MSGIKPFAPVQVLVQTLVRTLALAAAFAAAVGLLSACSESAPPGPASAAPEVEVAEVEVREVTEFDDFTGRFVPVERVEIRPRVSGYIEAVRFEQGQEVSAGTVLFEIDARPYQAALSRAEAELARSQSGLALARSDLARAESLLQSRAISREEYDQRVSGVNQAQASVRGFEAAVESAQLDLEFTRIVSPISGLTGRAEITAGNLVSAGQTLLTTVVSMDPIYVEFEADEQVYLRYGEMARRGERASSRESRNPVFVALATESGFPHQGEMVFVDNAVNTQTGTILARGLFSNTDRLFTPGLFARVQLIGSGRYSAVLVRDLAIGTDLSVKYVLVADAENKAEYRPVTLGPVIEGLRVVREGLQPGERVVVNGLQRLRPGAPLTPRVVPMVPEASASPSGSSR